MFCGALLAVTNQACWTLIAVLLLFSSGTGLAQSLKKVNAAFNDPSLEGIKFILDLPKKTENHKRRKGCS